MHRVLITDDIGPAGLALLATADDVQYDVLKLPPPENYWTSLATMKR